MSDAYDWYAAERERADGLDKKLGRVAFLVGYYGERAKCTGNADLAELTAELHALVYGPVPEDTCAEPATTNQEGAIR
jgi:hypothetical protein